jgi:hypothetical protein
MESNEYMLYEALAHTAWVCDSGDLERFAALVAAAEREACAKMCEQQSLLQLDERVMRGIDACAAAIRARSKHD